MGKAKYFQISLISRKKIWTSNAQKKHILSPKVSSTQLTNEKFPYLKIFWNFVASFACHQICFFRNRLEIKDILYVCSWSNFVCNALLFAKKETERQFIFFCQLVIKERYTERYCQVWHLSRGENWICIFCLPPWYNVNYQNICKVLLRLKGLISPYKKLKKA